LRWLPAKRATFVIEADSRISTVIKSEVSMNIHVGKALAALQAANERK
jgi:peroxiredoxin